MREDEAAAPIRGAAQVAYRAAIRKGGTFPGDGALETRWSGLVECVRHFR